MKILRILISFLVTAVLFALPAAAVSDVTAPALPHDMHAAFITPTVDFSEDAAKADVQLSEVFGEFARIGLNSVVINTVYGGKAYFSADDGSDTDAVQTAISCAYRHGITPFVVLDLAALMSGSDKRIDTLVSRTHRFARKYACGGIIIDGYYESRDAGSFTEYMSDGSGIGYSNWLYDRSEQFFRTAAEVIRETDSSLAAGIIINDMWANASSDPQGSATQDSFEAYFDGYSDTRRFVADGYADLVMVRAYGSLTSVKLPFGEVTRWWGNVAAGANVPMYVVHHNEYLGTETVGWNDKDQLVRQLTELRNIPACAGSVFNSFAALEDDPLGSTSALAEYYKSRGTADETAVTTAPETSAKPSEQRPAADTEELVIAPPDTDISEETTSAPSDEAADEAADDGAREEVRESERAQEAETGNEPPQPPKELTVTSPASLTFTTAEASVTFMGTFDENEPVYFNGSLMKLNGVGNFYFEQPLDAGLNTFTISQNDTTYTYNITRKIAVLDTIDSSVSGGKSLYVDGGTLIRLSVRAYKGASVYASVGSTQITLHEQETAADEEEANTSYVRFTGLYTVPEGIVGKRQDIGTITFYGSYAGYSMSAVGASVTVNSLPEPVVQAEPVTVTTPEGEERGAGTVVAELQAPYKEGTELTYIKTTGDNTIVYDGKTVDNIPSPLYSQLPAGAVEVYRTTTGNYYVAESGKRIPVSAAVLEEGTAITDNPLLVRSIGTSGGKSYIKLQMGAKTGFNMRLAGNTYYTAWDGEYNVDSFTATHLYITFENVTSVTALPSFEYSQVFSSGKWDTVTEENGTKFRLILELRQPGVYFGHSAHYDSEGCLILSFPVPVNTLSGLTVVIDPGHGYGKSPDVFDPGAIGEVVEQEAVLAIAKELETQLAAAGANVVRLKTESEFLFTRERPNVARTYGCDIFISIHANKSTGDARGVEAYYFTSFSQPLADCVSREVAKYYKESVYSDGADKNRGARYSYYHVTLQQDFPSILLETGFVDNIQDALALASDTHRKGIAAGIVQGIKDFISRSSIGGYIEGYATE